MGGAYTSKPEIPPSNPAPPDIPINWNPEWPYPGPNPPGYSVTSPAISLTAPSTVQAEDGIYHPVLCIGKWTDSAGGPAGLPSGTKQQFWTADIDGYPLRLKLSSDSNFSNELTLDYSPVGAYYQVSESVEFEIGESDEGGTITLTATSYDADGTEVAEQQEMTVTVSGNYLQVGVDSSYFPGETTNTMAITVGGNSLSSTDGADDQVIIQTEELETLVGLSFTGYLTGTNLNGSFSNEIAGYIDVNLFDKNGTLLSTAYIPYSALLPPGQSGGETKLAFEITDIDTVTALS